jgi:hypothetical protein
MGEATYYCKIFFESERAAKVALPKVEKFFKQGIKAYNYWQKHRDSKTTAAQFWIDIDKKFPEIGNYLRYAKLYGGDKNNKLAGQLDFGSMDDLSNLGVNKSERDSEWAIWYSAMVWHFADWNKIMEFIVKRYEAEEASWISDEYVNYFDLCRRGD